MISDTEDLILVILVTVLGAALNSGDTLKSFKRFNDL